MSVLTGYQPQQVLRYFEEICNIPHGSGETREISDYLVAFAKRKNLKYRQDASNNVIIWKDATEGYENAPTVMLQGHMDMVCEKESDCTKDMSREGLDLFVEGDLIGARGTTLGGDDGIAIAMALAVLDDENIPHAPLECVFTVDEEIGLLGAQALDGSDLHSKYMINIDSEKDKVLTVSCAGSTRILCRIPFCREEFQGECLQIHVKGLVGGHSGEEIHLERGNANKLLGRILYEISKSVDLRVVNVSGGSKGNAISREAGATVSVSDIQAVEQLLSEIEKKIRNEYRKADPDIRIEYQRTENHETPLNEESGKRCICYLFCVPNGVQNMSVEVPGLVQTSLNLGRVQMEQDALVGEMMLRSSVNSQNQELLEKVTSLCECLGGDITVKSSYSAWEYKKDSPLLKKMTEAFREVYGEEPSIEALHAGLECGIMAGKVEGLDCISIGPDLTDIHTPRERLHIQSTERIWKLLLTVLEKLN